MKLELLKENTLNAISIAEKIVGKNLSLPVLSCLLLTVKKPKLTIKATNIDLGIEISIPSKVYEDGSAAIPGGILGTILSNIHTPSEIKLESVDNNIAVTTTTSKTLIKTQNHDDFPSLPQVNEAQPINIKAKSIMEGIRAVWYSASLSMVKPELASIYIYPHDGTLIFVATDSFRLAEKVIPVKNLKSFNPILIPFKNVLEVLRVLEYIGEEEDITVHLTQNQLAFSTPNVYLTSRLIDGSFPDYKQIIPKKTTTEVVVLKQDLISALKRANVFSDKFNQVRFEIKPSKKKFVLTSSNQDLGETAESIQAAVTGEDLSIHFNYKYISDCFQSISADSVTLTFSGLSKPVVIRGVSDNSFLYLVMPMNR
jgi:DNA polymerase-3 subunit beta|tara:strand:+ start:4127 stop:5233 length:1107 start_codon:yes stop_codon:yes gene_type:complete